MLEFHLSYYFPLVFFFEGGEVVYKISHFMAKHYTIFRNSQLKTIQLTNDPYISTIPRAASLNS